MAGNREFPGTNGPRNLPGGEPAFGGRLLLPVVFFAAVLARAAYLKAYLHSPLFGVYRIDQLYYRTWGLEIAGGNWVGAKPFEQSPLYAYLLGLFYQLLGPRDALVLVAQLLAGVVAALLVADNARRLFGSTAGLVAGILAALYAPSLFYECAIMKTFLEPLLVLAAFAAALRAAEAPSLRWPAAAGCAIGLACLVREVHVLLLVPLLIAIWVGGIGGKARRTAGALALLGVFAAVVLPAVLHNSRAAGEFVGVSAAGGENLYLAFGPEATGFYVIPDFLGPHPFLEHQDFRDEAFLRTGRPHSQAAASAYWLRETWLFVRERPGDTIELLARKAAILFADFEVPDSENFTATRGYIPLLVVLPTFGWVAGLGLLGLVLAAASPRRNQLALGFAAVLVAEILLTFNLGRYRAAFTGLWLVFAGQGAAWLWTTVVATKERRSAGLAAAAGAALATALSFLPPWGLDAAQRDSELARFRRETAETVRLRETIPELQRALAGRPGDPALLLELGSALDLTGRVPEAVAYYRAAVNAAPGHPEALGRLAYVLLRQNRLEEAAPLALKLTTLSPNDPFGYVILGRSELLLASNAPDKATANGALAAAIVTLRTAVRLNPRALTARLKLARAYHLAGNARAAKEELQAALTIDRASKEARSLAKTLLRG